MKLTRTLRGLALDPSLRRTARQVHWTLVDQVLSSGTNFGAAFMAVRAGGPVEFGAFSFTMVLYVLAVGVCRAVTTQTLVISVRGDRVQMNALARPTLVAAGALASLFALACFAGATLASGSLSQLLLVLGVALPVLLVQDAGRSLLLALDRPRDAAFADGVWAVGFTFALAAATLLSDVSVVSITLCWAIGGALAGIVVLAQLWQPVRRPRETYWRSHVRLRGNLLASHLLMATPSYVLFALAPSLIGLDGLGLLRAAYLPLSVFGVVLQGASAILLPRLARREGEELWRLVRGAGLVLTGGAAAWSVLIALLPDEVGRLVLADLWDRTETLRLIFGVALTFQAAATCVLAALSTTRSALVVRLRFGIGALSLVGGLVTSVLAGAVGLASTITAADVLVAAGGFYLLRRQLERVPASRRWGGV